MSAVRIVVMNGVMSDVVSVLHVSCVLCSSVAV